MNERPTIALVLAAACSLFGSCGIGNGRTERKLAQPGRSIERYLAKGASGLEKSLAGARRSFGSLAPRSAPYRSLADRAADLVAADRDRAGTLGTSLSRAANALEPRTGPRLRRIGDATPQVLGLDRDLRKLGNGLRRGDRILGLHRQPLPDRTDWERRTDPDDLRPPASWMDRILRRFGL